MPWDLLSWGTSAARNGLTALAVTPGETHLTLSGANQIKPRGDGHIAFTAARSAGIANLLQSRIHASKDGNWWDHGGFFSRDQTGGVDAHAISLGKYDVVIGDLLEAQANNNNNAQLDVIIAGLVLGATSPKIRRDPIFDFPEAVKWIYGTGATTQGANTWSPCAMTWGESFDQTKVYKVYGMASYGATQYACRLLYPSGRSQGYVPGVLGGDTALLNEPLYGDFGEFPGNAPPNCEALSSGADTAQKIALLVSSFRTI